MSEQVDRARGGGEKFHPYTFEETQMRLAPQSRALEERARSLSPALRANRVVFEASLLPNYLANSYYPDRLIELLDLTPLGSRPATGTYSVPSGARQAPTKTLIVAAEDSSLVRLSELLELGPQTKSERSAAEELRQFDQLRLPLLEEIVRSDADRTPTHLDGPLLYEAVLHPDPDSPSYPVRRGLSHEVFRKFIAWVEDNGGDVLSAQSGVVGGLTFVPVRLPAGRVDAVAQFNPLRSIRRMPRIRPVPASTLRSAPRVAPPPPPPPAEDAPEVLVFDAGADDTLPYFRDAVITENLTSRPTAPGCIEHGSGVTGAILYGMVEPGTPLEEPVARVRHLRSIPGNDTDVSELYWLLDQIQRTVESSDAKLVNLSLGPEVAVEDGEPHRWTAVLDELAYERDILFVTAAGNNGEGDAALGLNRVQVPADMVNGLTVGACDSPHPEAGWARATYSAVGPGRPGLRVQPTGVAFGGTDTRSFARLHGDGRISYDCGTSYAAPLAVHGLAGLQSNLGSYSSAATLRAFAAHFAQRPDGADMLEVGHGRFLDDYAEALDCRHDEVTVLYQASLRRGEVIAYQLPVPEQLDRGNVKLRWTLAFSSPTDPAEAAEYTKVGLEATLRPHAAYFSFRDPADPTATLKVDILNETDRVADLIKAGSRQSQNPIARSTRPARATEELRRNDGKWETLWRVEDSLRARSLWRPRLDISQVAREAGGLAGDSAPAVDFTLIVTVRSTAGLPVYEQALAEFPVLTELPIAAPIRVQT
jgi:hypothetical protein